MPQEERSYRDESAKPELLVALSSHFRALVGFVAGEVVELRLAAWRTAGLDESVCDVLADRLARPVEEAVAWLLGGGADIQNCVAEVHEWALALEDTEGGADGIPGDLGLVKELSALHPNDVGVLFSVLMHHIVLNKGEALFVDAGVPHAYLEGFGLEVMLPSDNVVRAGLTSKHRDTEEFLKIAETAPHPAAPTVMPQAIGQSHRYQDFPAEFSVTHVTKSGPVSLLGQSAVVIVERGAGRLRGVVSNRPVAQGDVFFVSAEEKEVDVEDVLSAWVVHPTR